MNRPDGGGLLLFHQSLPRFEFASALVGAGGAFRFFTALFPPAWFRDGKRSAERLNRAPQHSAGRDAHTAQGRNAAHHIRESGCEVRHSHANHSSPPASRGRGDSSAMNICNLTLVPLTRPRHPFSRDDLAPSRHPPDLEHAPYRPSPSQRRQEGPPALILLHHQRRILAAEEPREERGEAQEGRKCRRGSGR